MRTPLTRLLGRLTLLVVLFPLQLSLASSRLVNISVRNQVGKGGDILVAGFVVAGEGQHPVLVRSVGPTLGQPPFNVPGTLPDPQLKLYDSTSTVIGANLDWGGTAELSAAFDRVRAFAIPAASKDAALLRSFKAGSFTCTCEGDGVATGEAILEVYDALENGATGQALSNLSLRGTLQSDGTFIAGFVIEGDSPKTVLIRGAGPSLADFGVTTPHPNPSITLYQAQTVVASNTDWHQAANSPEIAATARRFGAFPFAASGADAALLVTLSPGLYTVYVRGESSGQSGVVLVELYDADILGATTPPNPPVLNPDLPTVSVSGPTLDPLEGRAASFTLRREGPLTQPLTVSLSVSGTATAGLDYTALPSTASFAAGVSTLTLQVDCLSDALVESPESVELRIAASSSYQTLPSGAFASLLIRDGTAVGAGWNASYFPTRNWTGTAVNRIDPTIDFDWVAGSPATGIPVDNFTARWTGTIQVEVSQVYFFQAEADDSVWVWVDGQPVIRRSAYAWQPITGGIYLEAGVRHSVRVEMRENGGSSRMKLSWYANGILRQIIPQSFVGNAADLAAIVTGPAQVSAVVGAPFSLQMTGIGVEGGYSAAGLPEGLSIDAKYGLVSGTFTSPGLYDIVVSAANARGSGSARVRIRVVSTDGVADTDLWNGLQGTWSLVPETVAPSASGTVSSLASPGGATGLFSRRVRGLLTAPADGLYSFWVRGGGKVQFHLADSAQPADRSLRCSAQDAPQWNTQSSQRSEAVLLRAGESYAFELLQSGAVAGADNAAVGWLTPGGVGAEPFSVVPGSVLSHHPGSSGQPAGSVFVAALRPLSGVESPASGVVSVSLAADGASALVSAQFSGLGTPISSVRLLLFADTINETRLLRLTGGTAAPVPWTIAAAGTQSAAQVLEALRSGRVTVRVETGRYPGGELYAQLQAATGAATFVPPPAPAPLPGGAISAAQAARFLTQATMGPTTADIEHLRQVGYEAWLEEQWAAPASTNIAYIDAARAAARVNDPNADVWGNTFVRSWWKNTVTGPDQLRQRVAFALSEIYVVSLDSSVHLDACTTYYDMLVRMADGRHRTLLEGITLHPAMARYLSMIRNQKPDLSKGLYPDENYAREVMQLFSIGLNKLHPDGTLVLDSNGLPIPTYTQEAIVGLAHVFTGWTYASNDPAYNYLWGPADYRNPMQQYPKYHDTAPKRLIEGIILPEARSGQDELRSAMDLLHLHPNTGPFLARQLIQRLVSSNPSPAYVYRVSRVFADNGSGVRGDLKAVVRAVLLDPEARRTPDPLDPTRGKLREPLLRMTQLWRALHSRATSGEFNYAWFRDALGQEPLMSPTVFNFFQPGYVPIGALSSAGLVAPEFQITTETQVGQMANTLENYTSNWNETSVDKVKPDLAEARLEFAKGIPAFLDYLNTLFLAGSMSTELRTRLTGLLTDYPSWVKTDDRIRYTLHTLVCSPDYVVER